MDMLATVDMLTAVDIVAEHTASVVVVDSPLVAEVDSPLVVEVGTFEVLVAQYSATFAWIAVVGIEQVEVASLRLVGRRHSIGPASVLDLAVVAPSAIGEELLVPSCFELAIGK